MTGGAKPKRKGTQAERKIVLWLRKYGVECCRVPLSGSVISFAPNDIRMEFFGQTLEAEVKHRGASGGWKTLLGWLHDHSPYCLFLDGPNYREPLVVMRGEVWMDLMQRADNGGKKGEHDAVHSTGQVETDGGHVQGG